VGAGADPIIALALPHVLGRRFVECLLCASIAGDRGDSLHCWSILVRLAPAPRQDEFHDAPRVNEYPTAILIVACPRPLARLPHVMLLIGIGECIGSAVASGRLDGFPARRQSGCFARDALLMSIPAMLLGPCRLIFTALHRRLVLLELLRG
jgi:hypothetical protein